MSRFHLLGNCENGDSSTKKNAEHYAEGRILLEFWKCSDGKNGGNAESSTDCCAGEQYWKGFAIESSERSEKESKADAGERCVAECIPDQGTAAQQREAANEPCPHTKEHCTEDYNTGVVVLQLQESEER
jgi:hypothetical protein